MSFQFLNLIDMAQTIGEDEVKSILSDFSCVKNAEIERFVRQNALEFSKKKMASTFLIMNEESDLVGVFALAHKALVFSADILTNTQKKRAARFASLDPETHTYTASAFLIAQFGKNDAFGAECISGDEMMGMAFSILQMAQKLVGGGIVYLECEDQSKLIDFYQRNGFNIFGQRYSTHEDTTYLQLIRFF